jgi:hypothetical protein
MTQAYGRPISPREVGLLLFKARRESTLGAGELNVIRPIKKIGIGGR